MVYGTRLEKPYIEDSCSKIFILVVTTATKFQAIIIFIKYIDLFYKKEINSIE